LVLAGYFLFHVLFGCTFVLASIINLRRISSGDEPPPEPEWVVARPRKRPPLRIPRPRPPIRPLRLVLWKEKYVEPSFLRDHPFFTGGMILIFLIPGTMAAVVLLSIIAAGWGGQDTNDAIRPVGLFLTVPVPLLVGLGCAARISRERERQTLDSFLCTALDWRAILVGKALASIQAVSYLLGTAAVVWLAGLLSGGINILTFPFLIVAAALHVGFAAALGLYYSAVCRSTVRAMIATLLTLALLYVLPLLWEPAELASPPVALWELSTGYECSFQDMLPIVASFVMALVYGVIGALLAMRTRKVLGGAE
jgi:hypothetical protein